MRYYLDCEFMEDGRVIDLLSLALVAQDGRELYAVNTHADRNLANDWVKKNVIPHLNTIPGGLNPNLTWVQGNRLAIRQQVLDFAPPGKPGPEFWGYYADYDWVVFCQLFGPMIALPSGYPMYCRDLKQLCDSYGNPALTKPEGEHHALTDARWNKSIHAFLDAFNEPKKRE